jgi:PleD family two-component response regulator
MSWRAIVTPDSESPARSRVSNATLNEPSQGKTSMSLQSATVARTVKTPPAEHRTRELRALLIGENSQGSSHLVKLLEEHGCKCRFVTSYHEAFSQLGVEDFGLVLSPMSLRDGNVFPLANLLEGSNTTLFYFQAVEESCWWLPALRSGQKCFGSSALRPSEFIASLPQILEER